MSTQDHVFNQYFLDFLKKLKAICKHKKSDSHDAREVLRAIKKYYQNNDLLSSDFRAHMNTFADVWNTYATIPQEDSDAFVAWLDENATQCILFRDIPMATVKSIMSDAYMLHHYLTVINIFRADMSEDLLTGTIDVLKNLGKDAVIKEKLEAMENDVVKKQLERIMFMYNKRVESTKKDPLMDNISEIENTSLGKLAKEILEEVDVEELQNSIGNGDIMSALANPDGGFVKLLGTVSQKMISKMSTGEIKQENLLQDAMKLATQFGGGAAGGLGPLTDIASMFTGSGGGGGEGDGFDMSNITKMMSNMMGGGGSKHQQRMRPNTDKLKRMSKARDMRHKLEKKRKETVKENVTVHVEDD